MVQRVVASWKSISAEEILGSFAACGIAASNPDAIHCPRYSGVASDAYILLSTNYTILMPEEDQHDVHVDSYSAYDDFSYCDIDID